MKPFHTIAVPHKDILEGRLTMDIFAADLWHTFEGKGPKEYTDSDTFFKKTYSTQGLKDLLHVIESRLVKGKGGDPVIHIETPFGGGKTHTLIAIYHMAKKWKAKPAIIVGDYISGEDTLWGILESQLTGKVSKLSSRVSPGRKLLQEVIEKQQQPVLILIDELLQYVVKASGVRVEHSTMAAQTMAFIQELTELAATLEKVCVVITLPSSMLERYDDNAEKLYQQLQKISGRVERILTPIHPNEITHIIRKRLFSDVDLDKAERVIDEFLDYAEKEGGLLPAGKERTEYKESFLDSYPFMPEVIDILYQRWGSIPTFQRTRGVLRLLSLVVYSLKSSGRPYISLADFDLGNGEIKRELINKIGPEFDSVVSADITDSDSGARKVDRSLGKSLEGLRIGTRAATTIFMYSFSGGHENGAHVAEIRRSATTSDNLSNVVVEAVEQLKYKLFFLQSQNEKFYFSNQPNLNRILLIKTENIREQELVEVEKEILREQIQTRGADSLKVYLWPDKPKDVSDGEELKLVVTRQRDNTFLKNILESKGDSPRVFRNTIFFLTPTDSEKGTFHDALKKKIAYGAIKNDKTLNLTPEQKDDVSASLKKVDDDLKFDKFRRYYRTLCIPAENGELKESDMGIPTFGENKTLVQEVYQKLRSDGEIVEKMPPIIFRERFLKDREHVKVQQVLDTMMKTPGKIRYVGRSIIFNSVTEGVKQGYFGLGEIKLEPNGAESPLCRHYKEDVVVVDSDSVVISSSICELQKKTEVGGEIATGGIQVGTGSESERLGIVPEKPETKTEIKLDFDIPRGKVSQIMGVLNLLQQKFDSIHIHIEAKKGSISEEDYTNKIKEALRQLGIHVD